MSSYRSLKPPMSLKRGLPFLKRRVPLGAPLFLRRGERHWKTDERGLTTLEWLLLVAAVGGLATIGIVVVRGAAGDTRNEVSEGNEVNRLQAQANSDAVDGGADATNCARPSSAWVNKWQTTFDFRWTGTACLARAATETEVNRLQAQATIDASSSDRSDCGRSSSAWVTKWATTFEFRWDSNKKACEAHPR